MSVTVAVRNESARKGIHRHATLARLAERICIGEGAPGQLELSVLLCDDPQIRELNRRFRRIDKPTDVLSFEQDSVEADSRTATLGDIVISLETVERECKGDRTLMKDELSLLFCHGLLHLLGYDHATADERKRMTAKQAHYLSISEDEAWRFGPRSNLSAPRKNLATIPPHTGREKSRASVSIGGIKPRG